MKSLHAICISKYIKVNKRKVGYRSHQRNAFSLKAPSQFINFNRFAAHWNFHCDHRGDHPTGFRFQLWLVRNASISRFFWEKLSKGISKGISQRECFDRISKEDFDKVSREFLQETLLEILSRKDWLVRCYWSTLRSLPNSFVVFIVLFQFAFSSLSVLF